MNLKIIALAWFALVVAMPAARAAGASPESAPAATYQPDKVVYDVAIDTTERFSRLLDRVSYLGSIYADPFTASIVLVLHGPEVRFFANKDRAQYKDLVERAQGLALGEIIQFRMCQVAAKAYGLGPRDLPEFIQLVPMGDAEVVQLQRKGYAFMK